MNELNIYEERYINTGTGAEQRKIMIAYSSFYNIVVDKQRYERLERLDDNVKDKIKELEGYIEAFPGALEQVNTKEKIYLLESLDK